MGAEVDTQDGVLRCYLPSTTERERIEFGLRRRVRGDMSGLVLVEVTVQGRFWTRESVVLGDSFAGPVEDFVVRLCQVVVRDSALHELIACLHEWQTDRTPFHVELGGADGQLLSLRVGPSSDVVCSPERPTCALTYRGGTMRQAEWRFIVDEGCLRMAEAGLTRALRDVWR